MYILVVEDDEDFVEELRQTLEEMPNRLDIKFARSREAAFGLIESFFFDLVILDLNIPTLDGALDADPTHGHAVFAKARDLAPGTPVFVLTGSPVEDFVEDLLGQQQRLDIWSYGQKFGTVDILKKYKFEGFPAKLGPTCDALSGLSDVELDRGNTDLAIEDDRLIRIFARKFGGARVVVSLLGGGLSGAKVVRLKVTDAGGALIHDAVAKLGPIPDVRDEGTRFDNQVARLDPAATPRKLATLEFGAKARAGIFYGLADGFDQSGFEVATQKEVAGAAIQSAESVTSRWREGVPQTRRTIREVRQRLMSDHALHEVLKKYPLSWAEEFELRPIQTRWCCIHGDLHGENILVSDLGSAVLIDYGDVGEGPASLDPVSLELSLLFHPKGPLREVGWPSQSQLTSWGRIDEYLNECPATAFISQCREWAKRSGAGQRELAASAYSYLVRQLKYEDTDKSLVLGLLSGVKEFFDET